MICQKAIPENDLEAKICIASVLKNGNPFPAPIVVSDSAHMSRYICSQCSESHNDCPCCSGVLISEKEILQIAVDIILPLGKESFEQRRLAGEFHGVTTTMARNINICFIDNSGLKEFFWREM